MGVSRRGLALPLLLLVPLGAGLALTRASRLPRADFAFVNGAEVASLDPAAATGIPEARLVRAILEGLVVHDPRTLAPRPGMAESWESSADGLDWTFRIRSGAIWTNGDPVTAQDFVFSFGRLLDPRTGSEFARELWCVRGAREYSTEVDDRGRPARAFDGVAIRAEGDRTLSIGLARPTPWLLDLLASAPLCPVNRRSLEEAQERFPEAWAVEWTRPENLVVNGPFRVLERRVNDRVRLARNERYWDAANVAFGTIDVLAVEHVGTALNLYLTGAVGWIDQQPADLAARLSRREDFHSAPYLGTYFYRVNVTRPPLDDVRVRRALALAIDRAAITEKVTRAGEIPSWSHVPLGMPGWTRVEMRHADHAADVEEARRLLAECGFGPGGKPFPPIEIHYNTRESHRDIAEVIADSWRRELGVPARMRNQEWRVFMDTQKRVDYDVSRSSWIADFPDPFGFLQIFTTGNENNRTGWSSARYDELIARAAEARGEERLARLREAEGVLMEELPILPIHSYVTKNLVDPRLDGFFENALDEHPPKSWRWRDR